MRIISGTARGRRLKEPVDYDIRPTTDKVKESIFNIIQFDIEGRQVLDLFAGTGQMGIEALSRGAASAVFVDQSARAVRLVKENLAASGLSGGRIIQGDSIGFLGGCGQFDIIFLDPPYGVGLLENAFEKIIEFDILKENGIIICESKVEEVLPEPEMPYRQLKEYRYGKIKLSLFTRTTD